MGIYILIIALVGGHGPALSAIEFGSKEACEQAKSQYINNLESLGLGRYSARATAFCAKKTVP